MKLTESLYDIYQAMKPGLLTITRAYKVPNADNYVEEWVYDAYQIAHSFDSGDRQKKYHKDGILMESTPDTEIEFIKSFRGYLKTSFINDLNKNYRRGQKISGKDVNIAIDELVSLTPDSSYVNSPATIKDLARVVHKDKALSESNEESTRDSVNLVFFQVLHESILKLEVIWGETPIIYDIYCTNHEKYFDNDFRLLLNNMIKKRLAQAALSIDSPVVFDQIATIALSNLGGAIQKRLYRYFFEFNGGLPKRLPKLLKE